MWRVACWVALVTCACQGPPDSPNPSWPLLERIATVELEERPEDPIVGVDRIGRRPGGGFILADERAGRVRLYDRVGRLERVLGQPGDGPGELDGPTAAVELRDSRVLVVQRANPRLTIFDASDSTTLSRVPGQYGFWAEWVEDRVVVGVGSRNDRFAMIATDGALLSTFGTLDPLVIETPFWIFFASENAAVLGDEIAINTSFFADVRIFSLEGDSVRSFGVPPASWIQPTPPPVDGLSETAARARIAKWASSFTVVREIAAVNDSLLVVQYGQHVSVDGDPYRVSPMGLDVYTKRGEKLAEDVPMELPVVGGGRELIVLVAEPPSPWTIALYEWRAP